MRSSLHKKIRLQMQHTAAIYLQKLQAQSSQYVYEEDGLFGGRLGQIWLHYTSWHATRQEEHKTQCLSVLGEVFEHLNQDTPQLYGASLSAGAAGFGYITTVLHREGWLEFDLDTTLADLDAFMYESALELIEARKLDFWHGAFGILFYFLERLNNPLHRQRAEQLVQKIVDEVRGDDNGLWFPNVLKPEDESIINFSLSHGQVSFLLVLMKAAQKGVETELATSVVWRGVNFLLKYQRYADFSKDFSYFPMWVHEDTNERHDSNRLAICYGDLGMVLLLYRAAEFLQNPTLREKADTLGLSTLQRQSDKATLVTDSHFCHGAAGVAQFYHTFYRISGHQGYYRGYQYWIDRTVAALHHELETDSSPQNKGGLVDGHVGVALVLLTYVYHQSERLYWERLFLL
jgi:lantibiotic biosynthesis protein